MSSTTTRTQKSRARTAKSDQAKSDQAKARATGRGRGGHTGQRTARTSQDGAGRTITIPPVVDRVATGALGAATAPVSVARQVLPAKGGLPLYAGLGALGAAGFLDWPVAVGIGIGYAVLRRHGGPLEPADDDRGA